MAQKTRKREALLNMYSVSASCLDIQVELDRGKHSRKSRPDAGERDCPLPELPGADFSPAGVSGCGSPRSGIFDWLKFPLAGSGTPPPGSPVSGIFDRRVAGERDGQLPGAEFCGSRFFPEFQNLP